MGNKYGFDKYRNKGAYHWAEIKENSFYITKAELIKKEIQKIEKPDVIDLGCGDGAVTNFVSGHCQIIVGIDADATAIKLARDLTSANNVNFHTATMTSYLKRIENKEKYDLIYSLDVIEHLPNPLEIFEFSTQLLKPGGTLIIGTPLFINSALMSKYHWKEFTVLELRDMISKFCRTYDEVLLPEQRNDGNIYDDNYYFAICKM